MSAGSQRERLAVVVHEVRSPAAALAAISETMAAAPKEARPELVRLALAACRGIERIVSDVGVTSVQLEETDLASIVRDAVAGAALSGARIRAELPERDARVRADPLRVRQALDNLLANAVVHGSGEVVVALGASSEAFRIEVSDQGEGVPPAERERIFERGVRLDQARAGSGLGLAVARAVAEAHGGSLVVEGSGEGGSTFVLSIPRPERS